MPVHVQVAIVDFDVINFINFETEIRYAEAAGIVQVESSGVHLSASLPQLISTLNPIPGIVQVESFGMHFNASGLLFNGMKVEAIGDRLADNISIDMLCRVLVDLQLDSSRIADDLLSWYQRNLLDMMFLGDAANRNTHTHICVYIHAYAVGTNGICWTCCSWATPPTATSTSWP